jgi:hypothetical protein
MKHRVLSSNAGQFAVTQEWQSAFVSSKKCPARLIVEPGVIQSMRRTLKISRVKNTDGKKLVGQKRRKAPYPHTAKGAREIGLAYPFLESEVIRRRTGFVQAKK